MGNQCQYGQGTFSQYYQPAQTSPLLKGVEGAGVIIHLPSTP